VFRLKSFIIFFKVLFSGSKECKVLCAVEEIEKMEKFTQDNGPLNGLNQEWKYLKEQILPGDKLFFYRSNKDLWQQLAGRQGYILEREGHMIASVITLMN